ncbi:MAG: membrane dipeptidase [Atopobiaceae bacterium]|nr:membrane dipeptidase [Atopobiaceae bacterium]
MPQTRVFDLHCDTLDALAMHNAGPWAQRAACADGDLSHNNLALDAQRMAAAGAWAQCFAIFVPDDLTGYPVVDPLSFYRRVRDYFFAQCAAHPKAVERVRDARQLDEVLSAGKVAALLTIENGSPVGTDLDVVDEWAQDGVKMVTLTWNGPNTIASGHDTSAGLSSFGRDVVRALEDRKIVVDVSHLNDEGFWDLVKVIRRPFAASHSNLRAVCGHRRNLTDDQFRAIRDMDGIVGLNYCTGFVRDDAWSADEVSFDDLSAHIERFLDLGGEGTIALGSDFDGCTPPAWLSTCEKITPFYQRIGARFGTEIADRLFFENAHDFFVRNETL